MIGTPAEAAASSDSAEARTAEAREGAGSDAEGRLVPSIDAYVVPTYYRYAESFSIFPADTDWSAPALGVGLEAALRAGIPVVPRLGGYFLASLPSEETSSLPASQMNVAHFLAVWPGFDVELYRSSVLALALSLAWDFLHYEQVREPEVSTAEIRESVFAHGPSGGGRLEWFFVERAGLTIEYRHTFLGSVRASNSAFERSGVEIPTASGDRDLVRPAITLRIGPSMRVHAGYRLESIRIDGRDASSASTSAEYPDNEHTLHGLELGSVITFR